MTGRVTRTGSGRKTEETKKTTEKQEKGLCGVPHRPFFHDRGCRSVLPEHGGRFGHKTLLRGDAKCSRGQCAA